MNDAPTTFDGPSVDDLNESLRIYRRLLPAIFGIVIVGFAAVVGLSYLGTYLSPPYGLRVLGWSLSEWGLICLVVALLAYLWVTGRKLGRLLDDRTLMAFPIVGLLSGLSVVARHAHAMGMEWSCFFGPLRPVRR